MIRRMRNRQWCHGASHSRALRVRGRAPQRHPLRCTNCDRATSTSWLRSATASRLPPAPSAPPSTTCSPSTIEACPGQQVRNNTKIVIFFGRRSWSGVFVKRRAQVDTFEILLSHHSRVLVLCVGGVKIDQDVQK